jgi:hypothetical protein
MLAVAAGFCIRDKAAVVPLWAFEKVTLTYATFSKPHAVFTHALCHADCEKGNWQK